MRISVVGVAGVALVVVLSLSMVGCGKQKTLVSFGPVSESGMLTATGVSLTRRGTHILTAQGGAQYFLESKTKNLHAFIGHRVMVKGEREPNIYATDLPVIVVADIASLDGAIGPHEWKIPALEMTLSVPSQWRATLSKNTATFSVSGSQLPSALTIVKSDGTSLPADGERVVIGGRNAVRKNPQGGEMKEVIILGNSGLLTLRFNRRAFANEATATTQIQSILASIRFDAAHSSTSAVPTTTTATTPCGGSAGILCPQGYFCQVDDRVTGIGKCTKQ